MEYDKIIDFDTLTIEDCDRFYRNGKTIEINDGRVVSIMEET